MEFSAVLLAGGKSSRMGRDKACLTIGGRPLWERQVEVLRGTHPAELFISGRADVPYAESGIEIVEDDEPETGPLTGLIVSLRHARCGLLLVLAIDMPRMTSEHLLRFVDGARTGCGVVPKRGEFFEPLAAVYPRESRALAERCRTEGMRAMQYFVERAVAANLLVPLPVADKDTCLFENINTPAELAASASSADKRDAAHGIRLTEIENATTLNGPSNIHCPHFLAARRVLWLLPFYQSRPKTLLRVQ